MGKLIRDSNGHVTCPNCGNKVSGKATKGRQPDNVLRHVLECEECGAPVGERLTEQEDWSMAS
jgi:predicted RNA-binding Zn-ribbon protein involved in translation (DUF1610 family)